MSLSWCTSMLAMIKTFLRSMLMDSQNCLSGRFWRPLSVPFFPLLSKNVIQEQDIEVEVELG